MSSRFNVALRVPYADAFRFAMRASAVTRLQPVFAAKGERPRRVTAPVANDPLNPNLFQLLGPFVQRDPFQRQLCTHLPIHFRGLIEIKRATSSIYSTSREGNQEA